MGEDYKGLAKAMAGVMCNAYGEQDDKPLLTIELQDMNSEPVVKYKGKEIKYKTCVRFDYGCNTDDGSNGSGFEIEHFVPDKKGPSYINTIKKVNSFKR